MSFDRERRRFEKSEEVEDEEMPELELVDSSEDEETEFLDKSYNPTRNHNEGEAESCPKLDMAAFVAPRPTEGDEQKCTIWFVAPWQLELVPFLKTAWESKVGANVRSMNEPYILGTDDEFARHEFWEFVLRWATSGEATSSPNEWNFSPRSRPTLEKLEVFLDFCRVQAPPAEYSDEVWRLMMKERWQRAHPNPRASKMSLRELHSWLKTEASNSFVPQTPGLPSTDSLTQKIPMRPELIKFLDTLMLQEAQSKQPPAALDFSVAEDLDLSKFDGKLVLAGGAALSLAFRVPKSDWDLFFVGVEDLQEAREIVEKAVSVFPTVIEFCATPNAWTFKVRTNEGFPHTLQFVFRGYKTVDEILLGFDVDCCAVVYDGEELWFSKRAAIAVSSAVNHVDFDRLSTTYEFRLDKYRRRGFAVRVPEFDPNRIKANAYESVANCATLNLRRKRTITKMRFSDGALLLMHMAKPKNTRNYFNYRRRDRGNNDPVASGNPAPQPIHTTRLTGLDILLFLYYRQSQIGIPSDYSSTCTNRLTFNAEMKTLESPGQCLVAKGNSDLIDLCRKPSSQQFATQLRRCRLWPEFQTRSPGEQVVSSFHRIVLSNQDMWYGSAFYDHPRSKLFENSTSSSSESVVRKRVKPSL